MKLPTRITLLFMSIYGLYGVFWPFLPIILREQGLQDHEVNLALSTLGFAALLSPIMVSHLADRSHPLRRIMVTLLAINGLLSPIWILVDSTITAGFLCLLYYGSIIPVLTLLEAYTVSHVLHLKRSEAKSREYQSYRVWGSIGFILPALVMAIISKIHPIDSTVLGFFSMGISVIALALSAKLPGDAPQARSATPPSREAIRAAIKPPLRGIFAATSIAGLGLSIFYIAFPRFLQELGHPKDQVGLIINFGVLVEILLIPFTGKLVDKFGARTVVMIGIWSIPVRLFLVTLWPSDFVILCTQILHGPLVVGLFVSIPLLLGQSAGESFRYSLQALNTALCLGLARIAGPWLAAIILHDSAGSPFEGLRLALLTAAILGTIAFLVLFFSSSENRPRARSANR